MPKDSIFITATGQHVGKTTVCLGLLHALQKRFEKVGFLKPVGQEHMVTEDGTHADKDVVLFKDHFQLKSSYDEMSPVLFPKGFTKNYLDKKISVESMKDSIKASFQKIQQNHDFTIVEGTGHMGVGSIADLNNAIVAKHLGLKVVIIASGGLGSSFDELVLNKTLCDAYGVSVCGVILNRVYEDKKDMIVKYMKKALAPWDIPLLGCIPYNNLLSCPSMRDFAQLFQTDLIAGEEHQMRHFKKTRLIATSLSIYRTLVEENQLIITPASREDIILATLTHYWEHQLQSPNDSYSVGIILTGKAPPKKHLIEQLIKAKIPTLYTPTDSYNTMEKITSYIAKIRKDDVEKIEKAIQVVEDHVDLDALCHQALNCS